MTNQENIDFNSFMSWTNTQVRNNPFPLERYSVFTALSDAEEYALNGAVSYEGQIIAVTDKDLSGNVLQKVFVLDSTMPNGLRQLAAGDDASSIQNELNAEISNRIEADKYLSNVISSEISNAISTEVATRISDVTYLSNEISTEIENRISADEYLSTNLSISLEDGGTPETSNILKTYVLKQGTKEVGKIDIPKDFLVKSAQVKTVDTPNVPYAGAQVGDKYIDLEINAKSGGTEDSHIYIPIKDFFSPYLPGQTDTISVAIGSDNTISAAVKDGSITTAKLADNAVTKIKIADDAITNAKIADNAVDTAQIVDGAVLSAKIGNGQVTTEKLADDAVTNTKIADNAVDTAQIVDGAVQTSKIADGAVLSAKIGDGQVTTAKIADSAVTTDKINNLAVTSDKLATDSVTNEKIADSAVGTNELSSAAVTTAKIADSAVTTVKIKDEAVTTAKIEGVAVTNAKIADNAVDSSKLSAEAVTTTKIAPSAVTTDKINDQAVTTAKIYDKAVTTAKIADKAVTNDKLSLSAVTMDNLSSDVRDYIENQTSDAKEYVDNKISAISGDWSGAASKTVVSASQRDGKVTLSAVDIAIQASQVVDLSNVVGNYVPLLVASGSASETDKLQTASEVSAIAEDYAVSAIGSLDVASIPVGASKTLASLGEADGKISAEAVDIQITESQVTDLTAHLNKITSDISVLSDDVADLESNKLDKSVFSTLSNEIGLSAANAGNHVATMSDIASIAGAMHFLGAITIGEGETVAQAVAHAFPGHTVEPGDVVVDTTTAKEYVYCGAPTSAWLELGDETLYATKAEVSTISAQLTADDAYLSTAIDNKIFIDGTPTESLCAMHISRDDFYAKVVAGEVLSNELYIVSGDYVNAYGQKIRNVSEPELSDDAATKNYVDASISTLHSSSLSGVKLNGLDFEVADNVAALSVEVIDCGNAS